MLAVVTAFAPIWLIAGCGWWSRRRGILPGNAPAVLTGFAFHIAMPAVLFTTLSRARLDELPVRPLLAVGIGSVVVGAVGYLAARHLFRRGRTGGLTAAMCAGYLNSGNLGIPVAVQILDDTLLIAAILIFQTVLVTPMFLLAMDTGSGAEGGRWRLLTAPVRNPIVVASTAGLVCNATGLVPPDGVLAPLEVLGAAAVPAALFALGMSLRGTGDGEPPGHRREVLLLVALKCVGHPLAAGAAAVLLGVTGDDRFAVVLLAALPTAQVVFVYADRYRERVATVRDTIMVSSVLAMVTLGGIAALHLSA
ncbi:hypothetical protein LX16_2845 [Stackebrandtia albiflava]|uniref:Auxin efflux carrier n=1 Tax=Stackebrandtia albiflava TaxID=406432 RepID=A0A562V2R4_9ACTN|nr:AEC family transporter [Stackebrandtia albiflava]TWJ12097.1 hypothetical protein LX16_2845 [Stackebrandtia albiflava]